MFKNIARSSMIQILHTSTNFSPYEILQRVRILVNDISLHKSSWNMALRLELYLSSSKQQQAAKRGEMSQILHVM